jgi:hypothetical protein
VEGEDLESTFPTKDKGVKEVGSQSEFRLPFRLQRISASDITASTSVIKAA